MRRAHPGLRAALALGVLLCLGGGCKKPPKGEVGKRVLHLAFRSKVGSMDPVRGGHQYASMAMAPIYEPLLDYHYLKRPLTLVPNLVVRMPEVNAEKTVYAFELRDDVRFQDDPCFPGGVGRKVTSRDVFYSFKRMADPIWKPGGWWVFSDRIVGLDEYKKAQAERVTAGQAFDYDAAVAGLEIVDDRRFRIHLKRPFPQFLYVLAMTYTAVVPREAVERYGTDFARHPVGTGPFRMVRWIPGTEVVFERNPTYRGDRYPTEGAPGDREKGLLARAGQAVPVLDGIVAHVFEQDQPMWLKWRVGDLDFIQVPAEYYPVVFDEQRTLRKAFAKAGVGAYPVALLDFIYRGFNMDDPLTGGFGKGKLIRRAMALAFDGREVNDAFYNDTNVLYEGPIPPGLDGYSPGYDGPKIAEAKALLAEAGYPEGRGLPPIQFETSIGGNSREQGEMLVRQMKRIGVTLEPNYSPFPELWSKLKKKKCQTFSLAWGSDYPDAENNLATFYGPNESPGSNNFNYKSPEYDRLYDRIRVMDPGPERTAIYRRMRQMLIDDAPSFGSMARTRFYAWNPRVSSFKPDEVQYRWFRYVEVAVRR